MPKSPTPHKKLCLPSLFRPTTKHPHPQDSGRTIDKPAPAAGDPTAVHVQSELLEMLNHLHCDPGRRQRGPQGDPRQRERTSSRERKPSPAQTHVDEAPGHVGRGELDECIALMAAVVDRDLGRGHAQLECQVVLRPEEGRTRDDSTVGERAPQDAIRPFRTSSCPSLSTAQFTGLAFSFSCHSVRLSRDGELCTYPDL